MNTLSAHEKAVEETTPHMLAFTRNGRWGTCCDCPRDADGVHPERCANTLRCDHNLDLSALNDTFQAIRRNHAAAPPTEWDRAAIVWIARSLPEYAKVTSAQVAEVCTRASRTRLRRILVELSNEAKRIANTV